jgi:acyl-coenzyme A thioesterase PaaI-like protein
VKGKGNNMTNWPQVNVELPEGYAGCFGCGHDNAIGLKLKFDKKGISVSTVFTPDNRYQGWPGYLHGGIAALMLDEAMTWAAIQTGNRNITAKFEVRLKKMIPVNVPLTLVGQVTKQTRKLIFSTATMSLPDGTVVAESSASHFVVTGSGENAM